MIVLPEVRPLHKCLKDMKKIAERGLNNGLQDSRSYSLACTWFIEELGAFCIFTRDHDPKFHEDLQFSLHLAISFQIPNPSTGKMVEVENPDAAAHKIIKSLLGTNYNDIWCCRPEGLVAYQKGFWHYRLFTKKWEGVTVSAGVIPPHWTMYSMVMEERELV